MVILRETMAGCAGLLAMLACIRIVLLSGGRTEEPERYSYRRAMVGSMRNPRRTVR